MAQACEKSAGVGGGVETRQRLVELGVDFGTCPRNPGGSVSANDVGPLAADNLRSRINAQGLH